MPTTLTEKLDSRKWSTGENATCEMLYVLTGTSSDQTALALVENSTAQTYNDLPPRFARQVSRDEAPYDRRGRQKPRLNEAEIGDVVAFLRTLDDGFEP